MARNNDSLSPMLVLCSRTLILQADPEMIAERKWKKPSNAMTGVPVWSHNGIVCTGETYKKAVKLTFARGASIPDPSGLFNSSLEGNSRRGEGQNEQVRLMAAYLPLLPLALLLLTGLYLFVLPYATRSRSGQRTDH
jgi:Domain of unknown function (DU1801)